MATEAARLLTEAHRLGQLRLGAVVVAQMRAAWPLLDIDDIDGSFPGWLTVVTQLVQASRSTSAQLASRYLAALRRLQTGEDFGPVTAQPADPNRLAVSMLVTGPASLRANLAGGMQPARALDIAAARSAAAAMRQSLNGGRETITQTVQADRRATGWQRVTSGAACDFCSMLADRGAVYGADAADFEAHDGCGCSAEPVYA